MRRVTQDGQTCGGKTQNPNRATRYLNFGKSGVRKARSPSALQTLPAAPKGRCVYPTPTRICNPHTTLATVIPGLDGLLWQLGGTTEWGMTGNGVITQGCVEFKLGFHSPRHALRLPFLGRTYTVTRSMAGAPVRLCSYHALQQYRMGLLWPLTACRLCAYVPSLWVIILPENCDDSRSDSVCFERLSKF